MEAESILCQSCGLEAPTKFVEFNQNIGMLLARQRSYIKGNLCKNCVHSHFWKKTLVTLGIGWLGTISLILAPVFIIMNVVHYLGSLGMPAVPPGAIKPSLNGDVVKLLDPHVAEIFRRLNQGEPLASVARGIALQAGATPGQVVIYAQAIARQQQLQQAQGFPVLPEKQPPPLPVQPPPALAPIPVEPIPVEELPPADELGLR